MSKIEIDDKLADELGEKLLQEFQEIGESYPSFAAMFIDMVSIVSQQNSQINSISQALQDVVLEINKMREIIKESEWKDRVTREKEDYFSSSTGNVTFIRSANPRKKEDLN